MLGSRVRGLPCIDAYRSWTSIQLVYVRVPCKWIVMHQHLRGDDDTDEVGIGNELGRNNCG
jgi:hypothetical protein